MGMHSIRIILIFAGGFVGIRLLRRIISASFEKVVDKTYKLRDHVAKEKRQATLEGVAFSIINIGVWIMVGLMVASELGIDIGPLIAAAGIAGIAVGFGGQYLIRDLISGLFIIMEDQYRKGDVVKVGGISGVVEDITIRRTVLRDLDGVEHTVPNGEISVTSNMTKIWARAHLDISVGYDTNLDKAIEVLNRVGKEMAEDEQWQDDIIKPIESVGVNEFADSAIMIKVLGDTKPMQQWAVMREYRKRIKMAFDKEGIEIPFPQRTVHIKNSR